MYLVIQMLPTCCHADAYRIGLIGTLLSDTSLARFAPLLEKEYIFFL